MHSPLMEQFLRAMDPDRRDETPDSVFYRAANMTEAVLVVAEDSDSSSLVQDCFEEQFPVVVDVVRHDPFVPRVVTSSQEIVGEDAIRQFLVSRQTG